VVVQRTTCLVIASAAVASAIGSDQAASWWSALDPERRALALNLAIDVGIVSYGFLAWDYGTASLHAESEGYFGSGTKYGGADKLGHAFTSFAATSGLAAIYRSWGFDPDTAAASGALSAIAATTVMEVGDGLSREHGSSYEDELMNIAGATLGYLRSRFPAVHRAIDFRLAYIPSRALREGEHRDITTDYAGMKYLVAFKGTLFSDPPPWLRAAEIDLGYFTRGYDHDARFHERERTAFVAIGVNLSEAFALFSDTRARHALDYLQVPYVYLPAGRDL
jgi:hypothetical protein